MPVHLLDDHVTREQHASSGGRHLPSHHMDTRLQSKVVTANLSSVCPRLLAEDLLISTLVSKMEFLLMNPVSVNWLGECSK